MKTASLMDPLALMRPRVTVKPFAISINIKRNTSSEVASNSRPARRHAAYIVPLGYVADFSPIYTARGERMQYNAESVYTKA